MSLLTSKSHCEYGGPGQKYGEYRAYTLCSKFGKFPVNIRVASLEKPMEAWLQGPSALVALPAACLVLLNTGPYRGTTLFSILLTGFSVPS
jgi:hypothetical protein